MQLRKITHLSIANYKLKELAGEFNVRFWRTRLSRKLFIEKRLDSIQKVLVIDRL